MRAGRVSTKPGRLLLLLIMTRRRAGLRWNSCVLMRSPEAIKSLEKTTPELWPTWAAVDDDELPLLVASCKWQGSGL